MFIRSPQSPAESLVLEEEGGITLVLNERFLPYRPITIGGKQRAEFTWYPGSPEATVQMLGPEEDTIQLRGFWKDKFFTATGVQAGSSDDYRRGQVAGYGLDGLDNVAALVQAVDTMRRMGRRITLRWSGLLRVGHITSFRQTWHNVHDCEWEIDFTVVSQGEQTVPAVAPIGPSFPDLYQQALDRAVALQDAIAASARLPAVVQKTEAMSRALNIGLLYAQATTGAIYSIATGYTGLVVTATQGTRRALATLTGAIANTAVTLGTVETQVLSEVFSFGFYGDQDNTPLGIQLAADNVRRTLSRDIRRTRYAFAASRTAAARQQASEAEQVQSYIATADTDLRAVSQQYYGNTNYWRQLMRYNNLSNSRLSAAQQIFVPSATYFNTQGSMGAQT